MKKTHSKCAKNNKSSNPSSRSRPVEKCPKEQKGIDLDSIERFSTLTSFPYTQNCSNFHVFMCTSNSSSCCYCVTPWSDAWKQHKPWPANIFISVSGQGECRWYTHTSPHTVPPSTMDCICVPGTGITTKALGAVGLMIFCQVKPATANTSSTGPHHSPGIEKHS